MNALSHDRLVVGGKAQFHSISSFTMEQKPGEHATAWIKGVLTEEGTKFLTGRTADEVITILDKEIGDYPPVFQGVIDQILFSTENSLDVVALRLKAGSIKLDTLLKSKSYQDIDLTYYDIIVDVLADFHEGNAVISDEIADQKIGYPVVRYKETAWQFIRRLASHYNLPVYSDASSSMPRVYVGLPSINKEANRRNRNPAKQQ